jgi:hypothetical protein
VARQLGGRRWLPFHTRQRCINACPTWRAGCPDRHCRAGKIWIIEGPNPNEDQMRSHLSLAKDRGTAIWAKPAVHSIAAVCHAREVTCLPYDLERLGAKASTNRSAARAQVLAIAAPARPRSDRRLSALPTNPTAKAPACHCHCALQDQCREKCSSANRTRILPPNEPS